MRSAALVGALHQRSAAQQAEYWALLGRNVAGLLDPEQLLAVKSGLASLHVEPVRAAAVIPESVFASQEKARQNGTLPACGPQPGIATRQLAERQRMALLQKEVSFCFETVYSHPSKIDFIAQAKALGYQIIMVWIHLESPALNLARIACRVREGGHDVPADKVRSRIPRLLHQVRTSIPLVDVLRIDDNILRSDP